MQQFALLCVKQITIKNDSMTDSTREAKGEILSNASEHIKKKKKETLQTPKLQVLNANSQHSNGISKEKNNPEQHYSPERSREVKSVFHG